MSYCKRHQGSTDRELTVGQLACAPWWEPAGRGSNPGTHKTPAQGWGWGIKKIKAAQMSTPNKSIQISLNCKKPKH
jgi:hypothetical protein